MSFLTPRLLRCLVALAIAAAAAAIPGDRLHAQAPASQAVFRADINFVEVDAVVTDGRGNVVSNLAKEDFEILEDGKRQQLDVFSFVDIPVLPAAPAAAVAPAAVPEPDVRSNVSQGEGRIYLILLDDLQTDPLRSQRVKATVRQFVEQHLGPDDVAAVAYTSGRADASQPFTNSRRLLLDAVDRFVGRKLRSATLERIDSIRTSNPNAPPPDPRLARTADPLEAERANRARSTLDTLRRASELMASARGRRKALVYVSEGIDYDMAGVVAQTRSGLSFFTADSGSVVRNALRDAIAAATRANVRIYPFDPRGLPGTGEEQIQVGGRFPENPQTGVTPEAFQDELRVARDTLRVLAEDTGGYAAIDSNDISAAFNRIVQENSSYYVLGYRSTNKRTDGRFRSIGVRVKRNGLQVRARPGYVAPRGASPARPGIPGETASPELRGVAASPVPVAGLPMRLFAAPFRVQGDAASVLVGAEVEARPFRFSERAGQFVDDLDLSLLAFDAQGKVTHADGQLVKLSLTPDTHRAVTASGVRVFFRLDLEPGRYQLRLAGHETGAGLVGSVNLDLDVPDFARLPLSMSGLVITSTRASEVPTAEPDPVTSGLPAPPSANRRIGTDEAIVMFVEVYDTASPRSAYLDVTATITDRNGRVALTQTDRLAPTASDTPGTARVVAQLAIATVAPGDYALRVEAKTEAGAVVSRDAPITVIAR